MGRFRLLLRLAFLPYSTSRGGYQLRAIWHFVTDFGDTAVTVPLAGLMVGFLLAARRPRLAIGWGLAILGGASAVAVLKLVLSACDHPLNGFGLSSPSGHTAMSISVYGGFAAVIATTLTRPARAAVIAGTAALIIAIALSRILLNYHSTIEVAVGLAVGIAALAIIVAIVARHPPQRLSLGWLAAGALVVCALFHGTHWPAEQAINRLAGWLDFVRPWCS